MNTRALSRSVAGRSPRPARRRPQDGDRRQARPARLEAGGKRVCGEQAQTKEYQLRRSTPTTYVQAHEVSWRSPKHAAQWRMTLTKYCSAHPGQAVDRIDAKAILRVLKPLWTRTPETASRLQGADRGGAENRPEPAAMSTRRTAPIRRDQRPSSLSHVLPGGGKSASAATAPAMPYADLPAFMALIADERSTAARALAFIILTAARSARASVRHGRDRFRRRDLEHSGRPHEDAESPRGPAQRRGDRHPARRGGGQKGQGFRFSRASAAVAAQPDGADDGDGQARRAAISPSTASAPRCGRGRPTTASNSSSPSSASPTPSATASFRPTSGRACWSAGGRSCSGGRIS